MSHLLKTHEKRGMCVYIWNAWEETHLPLKCKGLCKKIPKVRVRVCPMEFHKIKIYKHKVEQEWRNLICQLHNLLSYTRHKVKLVWSLISMEKLNFTYLFFPLWNLGCKQICMFTPYLDEIRLVGNFGNPLRN
jgi:hypothetical protein